MEKENQKWEQHDTESISPLNPGSSFRLVNPFKFIGSTLPIVSEERDGWETTLETGQD